jgi:pimeloyl-ACP methyl ester carboxylesterase
MTEFVLLHGSFHSPWHWRKLIPELHARGHDATAVDLPGPDPAATIESFVAAIGDPRDTVLVAHSAAGLWAPIAADRHPIRGLVLLAALMPLPGRSWIDQFADQPMQPDYVAVQSRVLARQAQTGSLWSSGWC